MHEKYKDIGDPAINLIEECSELIHIICKGERFGWDKSHPDRLEFNNFIELQHEFEDLKTRYEEFVNFLKPFYE